MTSCTRCRVNKGQLISEWLFGILNSSQKQTKKFDLTTKGQLISKGLFGIFNSSKKTNEKIRPTTMIPQVELFSGFLKELKIAKRHFEINWPLAFKI